MSTPEQLKGDSLRRQLAQSQQYALQHGLELVEDLRDIGVSAFKGANIGADAALGQFLKAVRDGDIEPGSVLLVESIDRISRQAVLKSLGIFTDLINNGIVIVTLSDGKSYSSDTDFADLIVSIVSMSRGHEESKMKSLRIGAAWAAKRARAESDGEILTKACPAWLRLRSDRKTFDLNERRVEVVRRIFADAIDRNLGVDAITRSLNKERVATFGNSRGWGKSSVYRILTNRAVIGEHRPAVGGKPGEKVLSGYFPIIVDETTFWRAQSALTKRRQKGGRKGEAFSNVFSGIARCESCGGKMKQVSFGRSRGRVLACDSAKRAMGCPATASWRYRDLETSVLRFVSELDVASVMGEAGRDGERRQVEGEIQAAEGKLVESKKRRERTYELLVGDEATTFLRDQLRDLDASVAETEKKLDGLRSRLKSLSAATGAMERPRKEIVGLIAQLGIMSGEKAFRVRAALAAQLNDLIEVITVDPGARRVGDSTVPVGRKFTVKFRSGTSRVVFPAPDDPLKFEAFGATHEGFITDGQVRGLLAR